MLGATSIESRGRPASACAPRWNCWAPPMRCIRRLPKRASSNSAPGLRPAFPDNLPRIAIDRQRIAVNGLYRHGFLLAPALAELTLAYVAARRDRQRGDAMRVIVNGEPREISATRVDALLGELEYEGTHFAIALNYDVVPKSRWARRAEAATRSRSSRRGREGEDGHLRIARLAGDPSRRSGNRESMHTSPRFRGDDDRCRPCELLRQEPSPPAC